MDLRPGIYEQVVSEPMSEKIGSLKPEGLKAELEKIPGEDCSDILSGYLRKVIKLGLPEIPDREKGDAKIVFCNRVIRMLADITGDPDLLSWIIDKSGERLLSVREAYRKPYNRPKTPLSVSTLFTGGIETPPMYEELCREAETSDEVCFIVSFIKNSGLRLIFDSLEKFTSGGGTLKVLTTVYMAATESAAVERLSGLRNTEVRISYDTNSTRLHAKSYIFKRRNGFDTAFIGSSNLSGFAVNDGMEWNVKITRQDNPQILEMMKSAFDSYWESSDFVRYTPRDDLPKLKRALMKEKSEPGSSPVFDIRPYPYQQEILNDLETEREVFGSYRNLVVAATGTGKTIVSAIDYRDFAARSESSRLLYIAHRIDILKKSLDTFRAVLRRPNFGGLCDGTHDPLDQDHVFMTVSSFESRKIVGMIPPDYYDYVVVDETHHIAAKSYGRILSLAPKILLGLTATPERTDGMDILRYYNGRIASEIRLPDAINRGLLVPFHYFAVTDPADLKGVRFERGRFSAADLENLYVGRDARVEAVLGALNRYQPDTDGIRGIGFCVSIRHAEYMAEKFREAGIPSLSVTAGTDPDVRSDAPAELASGNVNFLFTVDLYNEGVDIPEINTVLFLRPTESLTVFIQQLGRGLRRSPGKTELTVLDFVGYTDRRYKMYEYKLGYLSSAFSVPVSSQIAGGFYGLPIGCSIKLEEVAREYILRSIKSCRAAGKTGLSEIMKSWVPSDGNFSLGSFLSDNDLDISDLYKRKVTFTGLRRECLGIECDESSEKLFSKGFLRLSTTDSKTWIDWIRSLAASGIREFGSEDTKFACMLYYTFYDRSGTDEGFASVQDFITMLFSAEDYRTELLSVLDYCSGRIRHKEIRTGTGFENTLGLHCRYHKNQILAAVGKSGFGHLYPWREGVLNIDENTDIFLISLNKSEKDYSPTTMYQDYAVSESLFHWQSQSRTSADSATGRRYTSGRKEYKALLFVRERKEYDGRAMPYIYLGAGRCKSYEGSRPVTVIWEMEHKIPPEVLTHSPIGRRSLTPNKNSPLRNHESEVQRQAGHVRGRARHSGSDGRHGLDGLVLLQRHSQGRLDVYSRILPVRGNDADRAALRSLRLQRAYQRGSVPENARRKEQKGRMISRFSLIRFPESVLVAVFPGGDFLSIGFEKRFRGVSGFEVFPHLDAVRADLDVNDVMIVRHGVRRLFSDFYEEASVFLLDVRDVLLFDVILGFGFPEFHRGTAAAGDASPFVDEFDSRSAFRAYVDSAHRLNLSPESPGLNI
ncbi:MAG: DUF3427 domain-containing protein [Candidatus Methanomethylophilaceae archaeon]|nr:DUF3427 domain-containing protein [Candidatus Methanomethylophilaceae archaeon]